MFKPERKQHCGLDLHYNLEAARNFTHKYSTHVFAEKAQSLITQHAQTSHDKVMLFFKDTGVTIDYLLYTDNVWKS